jgi:hypothetical protein
MGRACGLALLAGATTGCFTYAPLTTTPAAGMRLSLDINDRGRVALGDSVGPSVDLIEGAVRAPSDSVYLLNVESVQYLNGRHVRWSGEPLAVRVDLVQQARERRLSRGRTTLAILTSVGAFAALVLTRDLIGGGRAREPGDPGPGGEQ